MSCSGLAASGHAHHAKLFPTSSAGSTCLYHSILTCLARPCASPRHGSSRGTALPDLPIHLARGSAVQFLAPASSLGGYLVARPAPRCSWALWSANFGVLIVVGRDAAVNLNFGERYDWGGSSSIVCNHKLILTPSICCSCCFCVGCSSVVR